MKTKEFSDNGFTLCVAPTLDKKEVAIWDKDRPHSTMHLSLKQATKFALVIFKAIRMAKKESKLRG